MSANHLIVGNIRTMDPQQPRAEAMVVTDDRIVYVGNFAVAKDLAGSQARKWEYGDGAILPGLIDSHNHMLGAALQRKLLDLSQCKSVREIVQSVARYAHENPHLPWIVSGHAWHIANLHERRYPTKIELDAACRDRPVFLPRIYHSAATNSRALQLAGITAATADPAGGDIEKDPSGEPTGVLYEPPAFRLVERLIPRLGLAKQQSALQEIQSEYLGMGITGIIDPGLTTDELFVYQKVWSERQLRIRSVVMPLAQTEDSPDAVMARLAGYAFRTGFGDNRLRMGGIKVYLDGGASLGTALLRDPDPAQRCNCGIQVTSTSMFQRIVEFCAEHQWSVGVHTVGGRAIDIALEVFRNVAERHDISSLRFSIIHAYLWPSKENISAAARLGVAVATQPAMQYQFAPLLVQKFGFDGISQATPIKSWIEGGVRVAGGSDAPTIVANPFVGIWHAVTRYVDALQRQLGPEQAVDVMTAMNMYTHNAAWLSFAEHERGLLRAGMLADWIAVSTDPLTCEAQELRDTRVYTTAVGGDVVHQA